MKPYLKRFIVSVVFLCASGSLLVGCTSSSPQPLIQRTGELTADYITAKRAYVSTLEKAILNSDPVGSPYRLIAVTGPLWRVGQVIDTDNPLNPVTEKCLFPDEKLPTEPVAWSSLPDLKQTQNLDFSAGLPKSVLKFLGKDNTLGLNLKTNKVGQFKISSLESIIIAQDDFESSLTSECKDVLALRGGLIIRGVVSGKETFKSGGKFDAGVNLKLLKDDIFKLEYDDNGDFELQDLNVLPKMFLVAYFPKQERGNENAVIRPPTKSEVEKLEKIGLKKEGRELSEN